MAQKYKSKIKSKDIPMKQSKSSTKRESRSGDRPANQKVFITGISNSMSRESLLKYFCRLYPSVTNFMLKTSKSRNQKIPGFGFLVLTDPEDLEDLLSIKKFYFKGRYLRAEPYLKDCKLREHQHDLHKRRVFVGKIPETMGDRELKGILEVEVGSIESAYIVSDFKTGVSKSFGYATFKSQKDAQKAIRMGMIQLEGSKGRLRFERVRGKDHKQLYKVKSPHPGRIKQNKPSPAKKKSEKNDRMENGPSGGRKVRLPSDGSNKNSHDEQFIPNTKEGSPRRAPPTNGQQLRKKNSVEMRESMHHQNQVRHPFLLGLEPIYESHLPEEIPSRPLLARKMYGKIERRITRDFLEDGYHKQKVREHKLKEIELLTSPKGWKSYSLQLLRHQRHNIRLNWSQPFKFRPRNF